MLQQGALFIFSLLSFKTESCSPYLTGENCTKFKTKLFSKNRQTRDVMHWVMTFSRCIIKILSGRKRFVANFTSRHFPCEKYLNRDSLADFRLLTFLMLFTCIWNPVKAIGPFALESVLIPNNEGRFGFSVSISGNTMVVGAYAENSATGSASVYIQSGSSSWSRQQKLVASDGQQNDDFGYSVSISGDTIAVGAEGVNNTGADSGSVYVFVRNGSLWMEQQKLVASDGQPGDRFGTSVVIEGDTIVVGAAGDNNGDGSAYLFVRNNSTWSEQQKLVGDQGARAWFGHAVSISGNTIVIGSYRERSETGSAHVFVRHGSMWNREWKIIPSDKQAYDRFGISVSIWGDTIVIGSYADDVNGVDSGSAYVFVRNGATWTRQQKLLASDGIEYDTFGSSVAILGDMIVVGALQHDTEGTDRAGSAYTFARNESTWTQRQKLLPNPTRWRGYFGRSASMSRNHIVVGTWDQNRAFIFGLPRLFFVRSSLYCESKCQQTSNMTTVKLVFACLSRVSTQNF